MHNLINENIKNAQAVLNPAPNGVGDETITVDKKSIFEVMEFLKNKKNFNVLQVITGTDYADRIEVSYVLANFIENLECIIKTKLLKTEPLEIESIVKLYSAANFQERETFDMLGVNFLNHPDLRRILCPDDWQGFPLRKDYVVQEIYRDMVVNPSHKMNLDDQGFGAALKAKSADPKSVSFSWKDKSTAATQASDAASAEE